MLYPAKGGAAFSCTISDALAEQARGAEHQHQDQHEKREHVLEDRKSTRLNSSHSQISYAVFCLKKKKNTETEDDCDCHVSYSVHIQSGPRGDCPLTRTY